MTGWPEHVAAQSWHGRRGGIRNSFTYGVDFLLVDPEARQGPWPFSRNRFNLFALHDCDHGGQRGAGRGLDWAREVFAGRGFAGGQDRILLLTQPRFLGYGFNPVSFWLLCRGAALHAVIAEVNNTFGDRHCYFCARPDGAAIAIGDALSAEKVFHVSPFQAVRGQYSFRFGITPEAIDIRILLADGDAGLAARLSGARAPATAAGLLAAALRRPFGALRVVALIYWQAMKLKRKGAAYAPRPAPPLEEVS